MSVKFIILEIPHNGTVIKVQNAPIPNAYKYNKITQQGLEKLTTWLRQPVAPPTHRDEFFLKLNLGQHLNQTQLLKHLQDFQKRIEQELHDIQQIQQHVATAHRDRADYQYLMLSYEYAQSVWQAKSRWCEKSLKQIQDR